ncbi:MAG: helix-turn-helix transcriptional regulator [Phycisphaerales bacterium]
MTPSATPTPLTVDAAGAAALVGVSRSFWMKMHAQGRTPDPIRLGRRVLWRVADIETWVARGCRRERHSRIKPASRGARP